MPLTRVLRLVVAVTAGMLLYAGVGQGMTGSGWVECEWGPLGPLHVSSVSATSIAVGWPALACVNRSGGSCAALLCPPVGALRISYGQFVSTQDETISALMKAQLPFRERPQTQQIELSTSSVGTVVTDMIPGVRYNISLTYRQRDGYLSAPASVLAETTHNVSITSLSALTLDSETVTLSWSAASSDKAAWLRLCVAIENSSGTLQLDGIVRPQMHPSVSSVTVTGLTPDQVYHFAIFTAAISGDPTISHGTGGVLTPVGLAIRMPAPNVSVLSRVGTGSDALVSWRQLRGNAETGGGLEMDMNYFLRVTDPDGLHTYLNVGARTSYTARSLLKAQTYRFATALENSVGLGPWSIDTELLVPVTIPQTPYNVSVSASLDPGHGQVRFNALIANAATGGTGITNYTLIIINEEFVSGEILLAQGVGGEDDPRVVTLGAEVDGLDLQGLVISFTREGQTLGSRTINGYDGVARRAILAGSANEENGDMYTIRYNVTRHLNISATPRTDGSITGAFTAAPNMGYWVRVIANSIVGQSAASAITMETVVVPPGPISVAATSVSTQAIRFEWAEPIPLGNILEYKVFVSKPNDDSGNLDSGSSVDFGVRSITIVELPHATTITCRVQAKNRAGWGQIGDPIRFETPHPTIPTQVEAVETGVRTATVTWVAPIVSRPSAYHVFMRKGEKARHVISVYEVEVACLNPPCFETATSAEVTGLEAGRSIFFSVQAEYGQAFNLSDISREALALVAASSPPAAIVAPEILVLPPSSDIGHQNVLLQLQWPRPVDAASGGKPVYNYLLEYQLENSGWCTKYGSVSSTGDAGGCQDPSIGANEDGLIGNVTSYTITLRRGYMYSFRVTGINENGMGASGVVARVQPQQTTISPEAPATVTIRDGSETPVPHAENPSVNLILDWSAPNSGNAEQIAVYVIRALTAGDEFAVPIRSDHQTSLTMTGLNAGSVYFFAVAGENSLGLLGPYSTTVRHKTQTTFPAKVRNVNVLDDGVSGSYRSIRLTWERVAGSRTGGLNILRYDIYGDKGDGYPSTPDFSIPAGPPEENDINSNVFDPMFETTVNVLKGFTYRFKVAAVNQEGSLFESDQTDAFVTQPTSPDAPVITKIVPKTLSSVVVSWTNEYDMSLYSGGATVTGFELERRVVGSVAWNVDLQIGPDDAQREVTLLSEFEEYEFRLSVRNSRGLSNPSPIVKGYTLSSLRHVNVRATLPACDAQRVCGVTLRWFSPNTNDASAPTYGRIYVIDTKLNQTVRIGGSPIPNNANSEMIAPVSGLAPDSTYRFFIIGVYQNDSDVYINEYAPSRSVPSEEVTMPAITPSAIPVSISSTGLTLSAKWNALNATCRAQLFFPNDAGTELCPTGYHGPITEYSVALRVCNKINSLDVCGDGDWTVVSHLSGTFSNATNNITVHPVRKGATYELAVGGLARGTLGPSIPTLYEIPVSVPGRGVAPLIHDLEESHFRLSWVDPPDTGRVGYAVTSFEILMLPKINGSEGNVRIVIPATESKTRVFSGLQANTEYMVRVRARNGNAQSGWSEWSPWVTVRTLPLRPKSLQVVRVEPDVTTVQWTLQLHGNTPITGFQVTFAQDSEVALRRMCGSDMFNKTSRTFVCKIFDLPKGQRYNMTVAATNDPSLKQNFGFSSRDPVEILTYPTGPRVLKPSSMDESSHNSVKLKWFVEDGGSPILLQRIDAFERARFQSSVNVSFFSTEALFTGLSPGLVYNFKVYVETSLGTAMSDSSHDIRIAPMAPLVPYHINSSYSDITIGWDAFPRTIGVQQYKVSTQTLDSVEWVDLPPVSANENSVTLSGLRSNEYRRVRLRAKNEGGWSPASAVLLVRTGGNSPVVCYVKYLSAESALVGSDPTYEIAEGKVERYDESSGQWLLGPLYRFPNMKDGLANFTGLMKGSLHRFSLAELNSAGSGRHCAVTAGSRTSSTLPEGGPPLQLETVSAGAMFANWSGVLRPNANGGSETLGYAIFASIGDDPVELCSAGSVLECLEDAVWESILPPPNTELSATLINLDPNQKYGFALAVRNKHGWGPLGPTVFGTTQLLRMSNPVITAFRTSILVSWEPPAGNGEITMYEVTFTEWDNMGDSAPDWGEPKVYIVNGSETRKVFSGLRIDHQYKVFVKARNAEGWSSPSDELTTRTTLPAVQLRSPAVTLVTSRSAKVNWYALDGENSGLGYVVTACQVGGECEDPQNALFQTTESLVVDSLQCNTEYFFKVAVLNPGGPGEDSRFSEVVRTLADVPEIMDRPVAFSNSDASIRLQWRQPSSNNERGGLTIGAFKIFYRRYDPAQYEFTGAFSFGVGIIVSGNISTSVVSGLTPNAIYAFKILAVNNMGQGLTSKESLPVETFPKKLESINQVGATYYSASLGWELKSGAQPTGTLASVKRVSVAVRDLDRSISNKSSLAWEELQNILHPKEYTISGLDPNSRYAVTVKIYNDAGWSEASSEFIAVTLPLPPAVVRVLSGRATSAELGWSGVQGRSANILGFIVQFVDSHGNTTGTSITEGYSTSSIVTGLERGSSYIFTVATVNNAGTSPFSMANGTIVTLDEDQGAVCSFYELRSSSSSFRVSVEGSLYLIVRVGETKLQGTVRVSALGTVPNEVQLLKVQFGASSRGIKGEQAVVYSSNVSQRSFSLEFDEVVPLELTDGASSIGHSLLLQMKFGGLQIPVAQCEIGVSKPLLVSLVNVAHRPPLPKAFCHFMPSMGSASGRIFLLQRTEGVEIYARVCRLKPEKSFALVAHQYGDMSTPVNSEESSAGKIQGILGDLKSDALGSGFMDALFPQISLKNPFSVVGGSLLLYNATVDEMQNLIASHAGADLTSRLPEVLAACVVGAHDPDPLEIHDNPAPCKPCTYTLRGEETLQDVSKFYGTDWLTIWSLNQLRPGWAAKGTSIYYAHPYAAQRGELLSAIARRFGQSQESIFSSNSGNFGSALDTTTDSGLLMGQAFEEERILCIVPGWHNVVSKSGTQNAKMCSTDNLQ